MADSTLDMTGEETPVTNLGHGTRSLGPSDSSDTGSDVTGGPGMDEGLSDEQARRAPLKSSGNAGRDLGDTDLDSDSDRAGTGERSSAGVDSSSATDQQTTIKPGVESGTDELDDPDALLDEDDGGSDDDRNRISNISATVSDGAT